MANERMKIWVRLQYFSRLCLLLLCVCAITGCTLENAERKTLSAQKFTEKYGPLAPVGYRWIPAGISGVCTLALGVIGLLKERRKSNQMKSAILTKSDQIDKLILGTEGKTDNPSNVITKFMEADTRRRTPEEKKCLNHFDAIRKSLI